MKPHAGCILIILGAAPEVKSKHPARDAVKLR